MANQPVASSSLPPSWKYDVFLSFRGEDTRTNFTDHLYNALVKKKIKTFIDCELIRGEEISSALLKAIEESRISLVILSQTYASSSWCLEELVKILQCRESKQQIVLPVFFKVEPSDVRKQESSFGYAFTELVSKSGNNDKKKVPVWKRALEEVANLSGFPVKEGDYEAIIINNIVKDILVRVPNGTYLKGSHPHKKSIDPLQTTLDSYDSYKGEPFRDTQRVLRKNYDASEDVVQQVSLDISYKGMRQLKEFKAVEIKGKMDCKACERKGEKSGQRMKGVTEVEVDPRQSKLTVIGYVDPNKVLHRVTHRNSVTVEIKGKMDCEACERKVKKSGQRMKGVTEVEVDPKQSKLTVIGYVDPNNK